MGKEMQIGDCPDNAEWDKVWSKFLGRVSLSIMIYKIIKGRAWAIVVPTV